MGILAAIGGVSAVAGLVNQRKQLSNISNFNNQLTNVQRKQLEQQRALRNAQQARERARNARLARIQKANMVAAIESSGAGQTSGAKGALRDLATQAAANKALGIQLQQGQTSLDRLGTQANILSSQISTAGAKAEFAGAQTNLGFSLFNTFYNPSQTPAYSPMQPLPRSDWDYLGPYGIEREG